MSLNNIQLSLVFLMSYLIVPSTYAATFSNSSIDKVLGMNNVSGTFIDNTGATGGAIESASTQIVRVIIAICVFIGFIFVAKGLYDMYSVSRDRQGGYNRPLVMIISGSALAILPIVTFFASNSVQSLT